MIKLKSLFRRGPGPSGSSKQSSNSNNSRNKSQSTTSLNTAVDNEQQHQQQQLQQQQQLPTTKFYSSGGSCIDPGSERGVDIGDAELSNANATHGAVDLNNANSNNTLPHPKKAKTSAKKGQKQPKQLPTSAAPIHHQQQQLQQLQQQQQLPLPAGNVMSALAVAPGNPNSAVSGAPNSSSVNASAAAATSSTAANNNYTGAVAAAAASLDSNDLYKLNSAIVAAANYQQQQQQQQFLHNEQQQHLLLEASHHKMQELQAQLDRLGREKSLLEARVSELVPYQNEVAKLKSDLLKMQSLQEKNQMEIINLKYENDSLRNRLRDVVNSPLSDAEKHQIIQDSQIQRLHSSAPASIALPSFGSFGADNDAGTPASCLTPGDWDKHSSSSEISVACLQDKIIQMEETHYSTNEELQATLQELADLQSQLGDAHSENERLAEEKDVLFQSLCRQTEKLNDSRTQITTLQELLLRDAKQAAAAEEMGGNSEQREKKLHDLIKTAQAERESLLVKQQELSADAQELHAAIDAGHADGARLRERIALLDSTLDAASAERKQTEAQLASARDECSQRAIEMTRLSTLLENARAKIDELEADLARGEKTDLSDLLDASRKEKDALEARCAALQDQCSRLQAEIRRLRDQLAAVTEECKVAKNNAKCALSHLEYRLEQLQQERDKLAAEQQQLADSAAELQVQCKCHLEDKTHLQNLLSEAQKHLSDVERQLSDSEEQLEKEIKLRKQEAEEWQQFQSDLLMTVRVANDFKTEALSAREQLVLDNKTQKEKIRLLEQQIEKLHKQQLQHSETQQSVLSTVQQEMASRRSSSNSTNSGSKISVVGSSVVGSSVSSSSSVLNRQDSRLSVKTLIESIETNNKSKTEESEERYSSNSSLNSGTPEITPNNLTAAAAVAVVATVTGSTAGVGNVSNNNNTSSNEWADNVRLPVVVCSNNTVSPQPQPTTTTTTTTSTTTLNSKGPLREQQQQQSLVSNIHFGGHNNVVSKSVLSGERKDPLNMLAKNGGSKRNALLKWCQNKTVGYRNIDITNFSSSWNDGLAFCAILHSYLNDRIPYDTLSPANKRRNFSLAFAAAESVGIPTTLNINDMCQIERPDWTQVMTYVTAIYKHFET